MVKAPAPSPKPVSATPTPTRVCTSVLFASEDMVAIPPDVAKKKPGRPGGNASWLSGGVAGYTMPDFTIVARRLANSSSTNLPNAGPVSTAGVQPFFSSESAQDLVLSAAT